MPIIQEKYEQATVLLGELLTLLEGQNETNWSRGLRSAVCALQCENYGSCDSRFEAAQSIYKTMTMGGRAFSEYYISNEDEERRVQLNEELDALRRRAWNIFNP